MKPKYLIESDFLEAQVEKDVANYLGFISRLFGPRYRLLQANEGMTGADAKFDWKGIAFFLQFKRPTGLLSTKNVPLPSRTRSNEAKLQQIRRYRRDNSLADSPHSIFFQLRALAQHARDYQHNILLSYERPPTMRATYVCPTVLSLREYEHAMNPGQFWRFWEQPIRFGHHALHLGSIAYLVQSAPLLRAHATIVPHATVTSADHYYSFSAHASDVAFHSPELVRRDALRLSDYVAQQLLDVYDGRAELVSAVELAHNLFKASRSWAGNDLGEPSNEGGITWLQRHGALLKDRFGIHQILPLVRSLPRNG